MSVGGGGVQTGTVYYSMALKLTDLTVLNTTGVFISGFNNAQGAAQTSTPNTVVSRLEIRSAGSGFNIGIGKGSGTSSPDTGVVWDSATYTTADTIFVVGSYIVQYLNSPAMTWPRFGLIRASTFFWRRLPRRAGRWSTMPEAILSASPVLPSTTGAPPSLPAKWTKSASGTQLGRT